MNPRRLGPAGRTITLSALGLLSGLTMLLSVAVALQQPRAVAKELSRRTLVADTALQDASTAALTTDSSIDAVIAAPNATARANALESWQLARGLLSRAWSAYLTNADNLTGERNLQQSFEASRARAEHLTVAIAALSPDDPKYTAALQDSLQVAHNELAVLAPLAQLYRPVLARQMAIVGRGVDHAHATAIWTFAVLAALFTLVTLKLLGSARRDQRLMTSEAAALRAVARNAELEGSLQRGLDMQATEEGASGVIAQALGVVAGDIPAELLMADSSQAHFRRSAVTQSDWHEGCRARGPSECPAAATSQTRVFDDSRKLDTCPFLRDQDQPGWSVCVPVSVAGRATGVIHAQHNVDHLPATELVSDLELVARKAGERLGMLRVLARSEAQAHHDVLTGLPNRRTLEDQVHELVSTGGSFVVAFGDLDHFKAINDTYGHDTGDRALRLFARALRDSVRPSDLVARWGGEEFLAVLPDCALDDARAVGERVRSRLAELLDQGTIPRFTVTLGVATSEAGDALAEVVARADAAMLSGKTLGRDRIVISGEVGLAGPAAPTTKVGQPI